MHSYLDPHTIMISDIYINSQFEDLDCLNNSDTSVYNSNNSQF